MLRGRLERRWEARRAALSMGRELMGLTSEGSMREERGAERRGGVWLSSSEAAAELSESEWRRGERSWLRLGEGRRPSDSEAEAEAAARSMAAEMGVEESAAAAGWRLGGGVLDRERDGEGEGEGEGEGDGEWWSWCGGSASPSEAEPDAAGEEAAGRFGAMVVGNES